MALQYSTAAEVGLTPLLVPGSNSVTLKFAARSATSSNTVLNVKVLEGGTVRSDTDTTSLTTSWTEYQVDLTDDVSSIVDWGNLTVRFTGERDSAVPDPRISWVRLEAPEGTFGRKAHTTDAIIDFPVVAHTTDASLLEYTTNAEVKFGALGDPDDHTGHQLKFTYKGATTTLLKVELRQGSSTVIKSQDNIALTASWQEATWTLTTGEAATISDYTDLRVRFIGRDQSATPQVQVSWVQFRTPKAPVIVVHQTDAVLVVGSSTETVTHTTDAVLLKREVKVHTSDAVLQATEEIAHTTDAVLQATETKTHTSDGYLVGRTTAVHTTDAVLQATEMVLQTGDAHLVDRTTVSHTTNAVLEEVQYGRPIADISTGSWKTAPTLSQPLWQQLDETTPSDTDYIYNDEWSA